MARIRTIKPEFWTDEKIVELSFPARLLFIGLWNFADDEGRLVYSPKRLKMQIFPADDLDISELFGEIRGKKLAAVYQVDNTEYLQVSGFSKHQKIDRRSPSKLPPPPPPSPADSPRIVPTEGKGKEGKGKEPPSVVSPQGKRESGQANGQDDDALAIPPSLDRLKDEFEAWWEYVPLKVGKGGVRGAQGSYKTARRKTDAETLLVGIKRYAESVKGKEPEFIAHPKTWLNQERWLDETGINGAGPVEISAEKLLEIKAWQVKQLIRTSAGGDSIITSYDLKEMVEQSLVTQEQADRW